MNAILCRPVAPGHHRFDWLSVTPFVSPATGAIFWYLSNGASKEFLWACLKPSRRRPPSASSGAGLSRIILLVPWPEFQYCGIGLFAAKVGFMLKLFGAGQQLRDWPPRRVRSGSAAWCMANIAQFLAEFVALHDPGSLKSFEAALIPSAQLAKLMAACQALVAYCQSPAA
jgi:hypothetical protein